MEASSPVLGQGLAVRSAGELGSAIGGNDERFNGATLGERHAQSGDDQRRIEDLMHGPTDDATREQIEHGHEVEPALAGKDASGVGDPDLIASPNAKVSDAVRRNGPAVATLRGGWTIFRALTGKESFQAHEPGNAVASSWATQDSRQSWTTVGLSTPHELLADALT